MRTYDLLCWALAGVLMSTLAGAGCQPEEESAAEQQALQALSPSPASISPVTLTYDTITGTPHTYTEGNLLHTNLTDHWHSDTVNGDPFIYGHSGCCSENGQITHTLGATFGVSSLRIRQSGTAKWSAYNASGVLVDEVTIAATSNSGSYAFPATFQTPLSRIDIFFSLGQFGWDNLVVGTCDDGDGDGICDASDNCSASANTSQADGDHDGLGDACDACANTSPGALVDANGCSREQFCLTQPDGATCDDGNSCTLVDTCQAGRCVGQSVSSDCGGGDTGIDPPLWADTPPPCSDPTQPCDDGGRGTAQPEPGDPGGVPTYSVEVTPFLLHGPFSIAACSDGVARRIVGGRVTLHNTNLTVLDLAGNNLENSSLVDPNAGDYGYMLARVINTPSSGPTLINYVLDHVRWDYQGSRITVINAPIVTTPATPFTAPATGNIVIPLADSDMVSLRVRVVANLPGIRFSGLRLDAQSNDGHVSASFVSESRVQGTLTAGTLTPDPGSQEGFVYTTNTQGQEVVVGEMLVKPGYTYHINSAATLVDQSGQPLSELVLPGTSVTIPAGCGTYTVDLTAELPAGRMRGRMHFIRDPGDPAGEGPRVTHYLPSYFQYTDANQHTGNRLGYTVGGSPRYISSAGDAPIDYDYRACPEGRWLYGLYNYSASALVSWPTSFGPGAGLRRGDFRWPNPGINAISPIDVNGPDTTGLDRDGFTYVLDPDPLTSSVPGLPADFLMTTEQLDFFTPMSYLQGTIDLSGCAATADIRSGLVGLTGVSQAPYTPFDDERGIRRQALTGTIRGAATGVFRGDGTGRFEVISSQGRWLEGAYLLDLRHGTSADLPDYHNGFITLWKAARSVYDMQPGRAAEISAPALQVQTARIRSRLHVLNEDGSYRPFRTPQAHISTYNFTTQSSGARGQSYAYSTGSGTKKTEHLLNILAPADGTATIYQQALVPEFPDGTGRLYSTVFPLLRGVTLNAANSCVQTCATCPSGTPSITVAKTVTATDGTCPGSELITAAPGDTVKYCYTVTNTGAGPLLGVSLVDDNGTPGDPNDDFAVTLDGLSRIAGAVAGDLAGGGATASGSAQVSLPATSTAIVTNTAVVSGLDAAGAVVTTSDTASVDRCGGDDDSDGVCNTVDNCPHNANADQLDSNGDGIGDVCSTCTYTQGYWKNHNQYAAPPRDVAWPVAETTLLCGQRWLDIFDTAPRGDAWYILAHQWIAASLNVANGAAVPPEVVAALAQGDALLRACRIEKAGRATATALADVLGKYNEGIIGPGHCGEGQGDQGGGQSGQSDDSKGSGCNASGGATGWAAMLLPVLIVVRRRRRC